MSKKQISKLRDEINKIDKELLYLFNRRASVVVELAKIKKKLGKKLIDPVREKNIFVAVTDKNPGPLRSDAIVRLFERIIDESRRLERTEVYNRQAKEQKI
jgi:chorismate mutase